MPAITSLTISAATPGRGLLQRWPAGPVAA